MGAVRAEIRGGGSGSSDVVLLYLWILSGIAEDRSAIFSEETWLDLVADELRGFANTDNEKRFGRIDVQYAAGGRAAFSERDFNGVLSGTGSRSGTSVPKLGIEPAF